MAEPDGVSRLLRPGLGAALYDRPVYLDCQRLDALRQLFHELGQLRVLFDQPEQLRRFPERGRQMQVGNVKAKVVTV